MKILLISNTSWSIWNFRYGLMKTLGEKKFNVSFCAPYDNYTEKLKNEGFDYSKIKLKRKGKNPFSDLKLIFDIYRICKRKKPNICHNFTIKPCIYGTLAQKLAKVDNIYCTITGLGYSFGKKGFLNKLVISLYRFSLKYADKIVFQNPDDRDIFVNLKIIKKEKTKIIKSSGVDTNKFFLEDFYKYNNGNNKVVITLVSRMLWQKGIKEFVEASLILKNKYSNLKFLLVGPIDNENPSAISEKQIKEWQEKGLVKYLGEKKDIKEVFSKTNIFTFPSFYKEGVPKVLLEAGAMELPLVTTNVSGCREVVYDPKKSPENDFNESSQNGFLVEPRNSKDLAEKLEILIKDKNLRKKFGKASREKIVKEFDEKIIINKYLKIYNQTTER